MCLHSACFIFINNLLAIVRDLEYNSFNYRGVNYAELYIRKRGR